MLLLHRSADDCLSGLWELPSGGVAPDEILLDALRREVAEETGLIVQGLRNLAVSSLPGPWRSCRTSSGRSLRAACPRASHR
ncbi:NUDIX hydrolase [Streptomyces sp. NPDC001262]|uniref:NUDIX hydrolase n=1 Tax=unclassified Streptomyces TaxID=2593676 RepID=UPI0036B767B4